MARRYSKQRQLILDTVLNHQVHPTADQVYTYLKVDHPELSLGTVYRNLKLLAELGAIRMVHPPLGSERYDGRCEPHCHMICTECGGLFDLDLGPDLAMLIQEQVKQVSGHEVDPSRLVFSGRCRGCCEKVRHPGCAEQESTHRLHLNRRPNQDAG